MSVQSLAQYATRTLISSIGFKVLSEAERTAALYSLLQHSTQVQIRFFITVLQQMARADPMTALLSPAIGSESLLLTTRVSQYLMPLDKPPWKDRWRSSLLV